jgi:hypothetical protein
MYILADADGKISHIAVIELEGAVNFTGVIPEDFTNTFSLGKYTFVNGAIVETPNWVAPVPPPMPNLPGQFLQA